MESRGWCMKRQSQKGKPYLPSGSACTLTSVWCPRAMGPFLFLCLLTSPPSLAWSQEWLLQFPPPHDTVTFTPCPCSSPRLFLVPGRNYRRKPCFPHPGNFRCAAGHCPPLPPCLTQPSSVPSPLRSLGEGLPGPQCLSEQKSPPKH